MEGTVGASSASPSGWWRRVGWLTSLLLLAAVVLVGTHRTEERELAELLRRARPLWLLAALVPQALTYVCAAGVWQRVLARGGDRRRLTRLVPLGLAKLFADQALPSLGLAGNVFVVRALVRRGVGRALAVGALLVDMVAYRLAYALALLTALVVLAGYGELGATTLALAAVFSLVALLAPLLLLPARQRLERLPARWRRLPAVQRTVEALAEAPPELLRDAPLLAETSALELSIFLLDAATLAMMLLAVGHPVSPPLALAGFVIASVAGSLAFVPGGLGVFEGASVAALHLLGVPIGAGLAATLLLRGYTFWLPMLPGLWMARREAR